MAWRRRNPKRDPTSRAPLAGGLHGHTARCPACSYELTGLGTWDDEEIECPECGRRGLAEWILEAPPWPGWWAIALKCCGPWTLNVVVLLTAMHAVKHVGWPAAILMLLAIAGLLVTGVVLPGLVVTFWVERMVSLRRRMWAWVGGLAATLAVNILIALMLRIAARLV